jgi:hypothetical protein
MTDREPFAPFEVIRADCRAYLAKTDSTPDDMELVYFTFHARLWVLQYVPKDPGPGRAVFGGTRVLWYDSLKRKVVAETYAE